MKAKNKKHIANCITSEKPAIDKLQSKYQNLHCYKFQDIYLPAQQMYDQPDARTDLPPKPCGL